MSRIFSVFAFHNRLIFFNTVFYPVYFCLLIPFMIHTRKPFTKEKNESDVISVCSEASEHTVTAKCYENIRAGDVIYDEHPLEFLGYKTCAVLQVKPEEEFVLCLEYDDPLEKHHCIKVLKRLRTNGEKLRNIYKLKVKYQTCMVESH